MKARIPVLTVAIFFLVTGAREGLAGARPGKKPAPGQRAGPPGTEPATGVGGDGEGPAPPLVVEARIKSGPVREYLTRTLAHLEGFEPGRPAGRDRFGGRIGRQYEATGFFHPRRVGDRLWLIDPEGHLFLHVAVNSVHPGRSPANRQSFPARFGTEARWRDETAALLRENGFNGTGCWSDDGLLAGARRRPVYTPRWNFMSSYGKRRGGTTQEPGHTGYPNKCIFVFDPEFEDFAREHARQLAETRDDPYLLGHFSDNELPLPRDLLDRFLELSSDDPGRRAAARWLAHRQRGPDAPITDEDREAWLGVVAERYFRIVSQAIREHDPNHLYLGSRFYGSEKGVESVFRAAGKHVDVVSVNLYGQWTPDADQLRRWSAWSGRPVLITEWYAKGDDSGLSNETGAGWTVATQVERGHFYQNFTLALLESRVCVGWHWFKYMDNDPADAGTDPSNRNSNKGIVRTTYEPYRPLLDAMRELNRQIYRLTDYFDGAP